MAGAGKKTFYKLLIGMNAFPNTFYEVTKGLDDQEIRDIISRFKVRLDLENATTRKAITDIEAKWIKCLPCLKDNFFAWPNVTKLEAEVPIYKTHKTVDVDLLFPGLNNEVLPLLISILEDMDPSELVHEESLRNRIYDIVTNATALGEEHYKSISETILRTDYDGLFILMDTGMDTGDIFGNILSNAHIYSLLKVMFSSQQAKNITVTLLFTKSVLRHIIDINEIEQITRWSLKKFKEKVLIDAIKRLKEKGLVIICCNVMYVQNMLK